MQKLKLKSKKLSSGRFQINFSMEGLTEGFYGYLLADPHTSVADVIQKIDRHVKAMANKERYFQRNLFSFGSHKSNSGRILIFKNSSAPVPFQTHSEVKPSTPW